MSNNYNDNNIYKYIYLLHAPFKRFATFTKALQPSRSSACLQYSLYLLIPLDRLSIDPSIVDVVFPHRSFFIWLISDDHLSNQFTVCASRMTSPRSNFFPLRKSCESGTLYSLYKFAFFSNNFFFFFGS